MRIVVVYCILFVLLLAACVTKPDTCKEQSSWQLHIGFKKIKVVSTLNTIKDSALRSFRTKLISRYDTTVWDVSSSTRKSISFPLIQSSDTSVFSVNLNGKKASTLYVIYKRNRTFENYSCGFRTSFQLDTVYTDPPICDSIIIVQPNITDVYQENCRFYLNNDSTLYP